MQPAHATRPDVQKQVAQFITVALQPNVLQFVSLAFLPDALSWHYYALVFILSFLLPVFCYVGYVRALGLPLGFDIARKHRLVPFLVNITCLAGLFYILRTPDTQFVSTFVDLMFLLQWVTYLIAVNSVTMFITFLYKVSLHVAAGTALFMGLSILQFGCWYILLAPALITIGALAWARYTLRAHSISQVLLAVAVGIITPFLFESLKKYFYILNY